MTAQSGPISEKVLAPWTADEVAALDEYQRSGSFHPYTCPNGHGRLIATVDGWMCIAGEYTQDWAHAFTITIGRAAVGAEVEGEA